MELKALQTTLRKFAAERDWQTFHTPKNLAMALMVEAAELAEIFQWMTPEQSQVAHTDRVLQQQIGDEVADVLLYLLQIADHTGLDLKRSVEHKLVKNAKKHPPTRPGQPAGTAAGSEVQTHVLVDWENVQPKDSDIRGLVPDVTDVWIFHGPNQKRAGAHHASFGDRLTLVPIARTGKNALDFHLSFYMGYIASRHPDARFVVLSNDTGYAPMLAHATDLGFAARPLGFVKGKAATGRTTPARASPTITSATAAAATKADNAPARKRARAREAGAPTVDAPAVSDRKASRTKAPAVAVKAVPAPPATAAKTARRGRQAAASPIKPATLPAVRPKGGKSATQAKPERAARPESAAKPTPAARSPARQPKDDGASSLARSVQHVQAGLRKTANKPTRQARLLATIQSLLGSGADDALVQAVLSRLLASGTVRIDDKGRVAFAPPVA